MTSLGQFAVRLAPAALLALGLAGCAAPGHKGESHAGMQGMHEMQAGCEKHGKMMAGKSTAEQQAMMQEHMQAMAPEMRQRMQAMHAHCK